MRFGLSKSAVFRWSKKLEPQRHRNKPWYKIDEAALRRDIEAYPDSYCREGAKGRTNAIGALIKSTLITIGLVSCSVDMTVFTAWTE